MGDMAGYKHDLLGEKVQNIPQWRAEEGGMGTSGIKRIKLVQQPRPVESAQVQPRLQPSQSQPTEHAIPPAACLYHMAVSAHHASTAHLQQSFIPQTVHTVHPNDAPPIIASGNMHKSHPYQPDPGASDKALGLCLLALDLLRAGLVSRSLSEVERVAFGLEFGNVAIKVITTLAPSKRAKGKQPVVVDLERLWRDVLEAVGQSVSAHIVRVRRG